MKTMNKRMMMLVAGLAWAGAALAATHEGVQLWENGPLWAKTNVGANSPTETGYYFWWGDTLGYKWQNSKWVASDGSVSGFSFSTANCPTYGKSLAQLQSMGAVGADGNLLPAYDAAAQQWGDDWRVPKASELKNLIELCSWSWTTNSGVTGYTVTGKGLYSGNSIFLPAAGYGEVTTTNYIAKAGNYWGATADGSATTTPRVTFCETSRGTLSTSTISRRFGLSIRPVKSMSAAKAASAVALDTRTGTRVAKTTESIAYDTAWGGASSGTLKVNGTAVSGLSSKGTYSWTPNTSQTNYWKLAYTAGTANYSATFKHSGYYAITYANTKGAANSNPAQYNIDSSITFTPLANVTGYVFNGWNPASIPAGGFGAKTVTAQWTPITYSVKFNKNGGTGTMADESFTYGTAKALTANAFTRTGYTFKGWKNGNTAITAATALPDVATVTLTAQWQVNQYEQTFDANGGDGSKAVAQDFDSALAVPTVTRTGYTFVGWTPAVPAKVPAQDVTYKAQWQVITETVTLDLGGGTGSGSATVNYGTKVSSLPVPTRDHYEFVGWFAEDGTPVSGDTLITANLKLHARWKAVYYLYGDVGGAVPPAASTYDGYLYKGEELAGTITVKVGKPTKAGLSSVKATVILANGSKVTLTTAGKGTAMSKDAPTTVTLTGGAACEVTLGSDGMKGTYGEYGIDGARNVFVSKDPQDRPVAGAALSAWYGAVNVAWSGASGWNALSVSIANKGKASVSGSLADGTKVTAKSQVIVGEEWCCVPVLVTRKANLAFLLWLPLDGSAKPGTLGLGEGVKADKPGLLKGGQAAFHIDSTAFTAMWGKSALPYLPDGVTVKGGQQWGLPKAGKVTYESGSTTVDAAKLQDNPAALKLKFKSKNGTFSGSFKAYVDVNGKLKATTVAVSGVLVNGVGYGTATIKKVGSVPVTVE